MKKYTLGFIFSDDLQKVLMIKKSRPEAQAGKMNGIGGKFEPEDIDAPHCISREVKEEADISIPPEMWAEVGAFSDNVNFNVAILTTTVPLSLLQAAKTMTDEEVLIIDTDNLEDFTFAEQAKEMLLFCKGHYI